MKNELFLVCKGDYFVSDFHDCENAHYLMYSDLPEQAYLFHSCQEVLDTFDAHFLGKLLPSLEVKQIFFKEVHLAKAQTSRPKNRS